MASDPVVALCAPCIDSGGRDEALARALLVAWEALDCRMLVAYCGEYGKPLCNACEARERILAIVEGRDEGQGTPFRAAKTTPLYPMTTRERAIARDLAEEGRDG